MLTPVVPFAKSMLTFRGEGGGVWDRQNRYYVICECSLNPTCASRGMTAENADGGDSCGSVTDSEDERMKDKESFREFAHLLCECYDCRSSLNAVSADQISHGKRSQQLLGKSKFPNGCGSCVRGSFSCTDRWPRKWLEPCQNHTALDRDSHAELTNITTKTETCLLSIFLYLIQNAEIPLSGAARACLDIFKTRLLSNSFCIFSPKWRYKGGNGICP